MEASRLAGKRVVVLGLARQGIALAKFLVSRKALVVVSDRKPESALQKEMTELSGLPVTYALGGHPLDLLGTADMLCLSGGVPIDLPIVEEARRQGIALSSDAQLFFEATPAKIVGITGSAGKTTTTMLVGRMMQQASAAGTIGKAWVGGNIGNPLLHDVDAMRPGDVAVMELSSFQLDLVHQSPQVAAVLNITPNHLDRHHTMEAYRDAKAHIVEFQSSEEDAILNWEDPESKKLMDRAKSHVRFFGIGPREWSGEGAFVEDGWVTLAKDSSDLKAVPLDAIALRGAHNLANVAAACAISDAAGAQPEQMQKAVDGFRGAPHRLELVGEAKGAKWYDDSIATAPERAMAGIRAFTEPIVLLAGGRDKKLPWRDWSLLVRERVDHLVLFGEAAGLIETALKQTDGIRPYSIARCRRMEDAVTAAAEVAGPGDVVLLSPGGTSFDAFRDFEERGNRFQELVRKLAQGDNS